MAHPGMIYLGTSGFAFDDWKGPVYPDAVPRTQWLTFYERELGFNALEVNYTYYQMPSARTMEGMLRKVSPAFQFAVKTHRSLTHDVLQDGRVVDHPPAFEAFRRGLTPLTNAGQLGCVLAQFPYAFTNIESHRTYLSAVADRLGPLNLVVEFRHRSWVAPQTWAWLRERGVGACVVDEPALSRLMPWVSETTSDTGYVRFHGRNAAAWFGTSSAERYDYCYSEGELGELAERTTAVAAHAKTTYVFFNNCHAGSAAKNARQFRERLEAQGFLVTPSHES